MREPRLRVVWSALAASLAAAFLALVFAVPVPPTERFAFALLALVAAAAFAYLTLNVMNFRRRLYAFVRQILAGNYEAGIPVRRDARDQTAQLEKLLNRLAEQLSEYDRLRADRVRLAHRAFDSLFQSVLQGVILADVEKEIFRFNPVMQLQYGVEQPSVSFSALENIEANKAFMQIVRTAIDIAKLPQDGEVTLQLPTRNVSQPLYIRATPIKDRDDKVKLVIIIILTPEIMPGLPGPTDAPAGLWDDEPSEPGDAGRAAPLTPNPNTGG